MAAAILTEVVSLWPGRDQYIDHSAAFAGGQPFTLFQNLQLQQTEHTLYLAHSKYLAFAGTATLKVAFDLAQGGFQSPANRGGNIVDGQVWRVILLQSIAMLRRASKMDSTAPTGCPSAARFNSTLRVPQTAQTAVNGVTSYWLRALGNATLVARSKPAPARNRNHPACNGNSTRLRSHTHMQHGCCPRGFKNLCAGWQFGDSGSPA